MTSKINATHRALEAYFKAKMREAEAAEKTTEAKRETWLAARHLERMEANLSSLLGDQWRSWVNEDVDVGIFGFKEACEELAKAEEIT